MGEKILVGVAWPYINGEKHIGQIAGAYLPPDIFARYQRMIGNDVLMVSGSDTHGTPIMLKADADGMPYAEVVEKYHGLFVDGCLKMGLTFDLYTHTDTENHWDVTQQMFVRHWETGFVYLDVQKQWFDPLAKKFLADRYIEGICPFCGYDGARGDQCDNCGRLYDALELKNPRSKLTGTTDLEIRETEHFFLDMAKMNQPLLDWISEGKEHWRPNVINFTRGQLELRELRGRAITRDLDWGVTIPIGNYPDKRIYVWYDAVIGYYSAAIEWAKLSGKPEAWREWWDADVNPSARLYNFVGKDNIPFHTIIWPGMLIGYNRGATHLNLPYDVPASEYLFLHGGKFSTSRGNVIGWNTVLREFQADAWRYALTAMAPETADVDFTWQDFMDRVNNELVANWGNLVNRMLGFAYKRFDAAVPAPGELDATGYRLPRRDPRGVRQRGEPVWSGQVQGCAAGSAPYLAARQPVSQRTRAVEDDRRGPHACCHHGLRRAAGHRLAQDYVGAHPAAQQRTTAPDARLRTTSLWPPIHRAGCGRPRRARGPTLRPYTRQRAVGSHDAAARAAVA